MSELVQTNKDEQSPSQPKGPADDNLKEIRRIVAKFTSEASSFSGPLPPPEILSKYEKVFPGAAERIFLIAENQAKHRQELEQKTIHSEFLRSYCGLGAGLLISLVSIISGAVLVNNGHDSAGTIISTGAVVALAGVFVYGSMSRKNERIQKSVIMGAAANASQERTKADLSSEMKPSSSKSNS